MPSSDAVLVASCTGHVSGVGSIGCGGRTHNGAYTRYESMPHGTSLLFDRKPLTLNWAQCTTACTQVAARAPALDRCTVATARYCAS
jgi:hypothetical protein